MNDGNYLGCFIVLVDG